MLKPNWSVQNEIQRRVDKEAWHDFWENIQPGKLLELKKIEVKRSKVWWLNFFISELRP